MISTKGRYALRVMIDLAENDSGKYIPLKDVADRQGISKKYLEIIVKDLVKGGLVRERFPHDSGLPGTGCHGVPPGSSLSDSAPVDGV